MFSVKSLLGTAHGAGEPEVANLWPTSIGDELPLPARGKVRAAIYTFRATIVSPNYEPVFDHGANEGKYLQGRELPQVITQETSIDPGCCLPRGSAPDIGERELCVRFVTQL